MICLNEFFMIFFMCFSLCFSFFSMLLSVFQCFPFIYIYNIINRKKASLFVHVVAFLKRFS